MAVALQENLNMMNDNMYHIRFLEEKLIEGLNEAGIVFRRNGSATHIAGNISLSFPDRDGEAILHRMDLLGISISTGSACDSKNNQVSHVLKAINLEERYARGTIRISLSSQNTEADVQTIVDVIKKIK